MRRLLRKVWLERLYYPLNQLDSNKMLDSIVTKKDYIMDVYDQICEHYLKFTGTSMMALVMNLVLLLKSDANDK